MKKKDFKKLLILIFVVNSQISLGATGETGEDGVGKTPKASVSHSQLAGAASERHRRTGATTVGGSGMRTSLVVFKGCLFKTGVIGREEVSDTDFAPKADHGKRLVDKFTELTSENRRLTADMQRAAEEARGYKARAVEAEAKIAFEEGNTERLAALERLLAEKEDEIAGLKASVIRREPGEALRIKELERLLAESEEQIKNLMERNSALEEGARMALDRTRASARECETVRRRRENAAAKRRLDQVSSRVASMMGSPVPAGRQAKAAAAEIMSALSPAERASKGDRTVTKRRGAAVGSPALERGSTPGTGGAGGYA